MNRLQWWIDSGMAADAAHGLVWWVGVMFVIGGYAIWRGEK